MDCPVEEAYMGDLSCNSVASRCDSAARHGVVFSHAATPLEVQSSCQATNCAVQRGVLAQGHPGLYHQDCHRGDIQESTCCAAAKASGVVKEGWKPSTILSRARAYQCIYRGIWPADAGDMHQRASALRTLILEELSLEPLILQLKYGPWRSAVVKA